MKLRDLTLLGKKLIQTSGQKIHNFTRRNFPMTFKTRDFAQSPDLAVNDSNVEIFNLKNPPLQDLVLALSKGMKKHFKIVQVDVVDCPILTLPPFNLAAEGLSGTTAVVQVGDPSNVVPVTLKHKVYDFQDVAAALSLKSSFIIGAGGGNWFNQGTLLEMFTNVLTTENSVQNFSKLTFSKNKTCEGITFQKADLNDSKFAGLANFFVSQGKSGKVIRIYCKHRLSKENFPSSINSSLREFYEFPLAFGSIFQMLQGRARHHVPPFFADGVRNTNDWFKWVLLPEISAPFVATGTLLTNNPPGWCMSSQHFHSATGGHFQCDITPHEAEYVAYITPAEKLCSIDKSFNSLSLFNYEVS